MAIVLLAPSPPLLFMGEEFGADTPFLFFCDFEKDLAKAVTEGRRNEFARFARFNDPAQRERIPDPNAATTFEASRLDWNEMERPRHREWLRFYRHLLTLRCQHIVPRLFAGCGLDANYEILGDRVLTVGWKFPNRADELILMANLGADSLSVSLPSASSVIYASDELSAGTLAQGMLPPWSVVWFLK
jgi:1,4-alpha-glucan branching enzyme